MIIYALLNVTDQNSLCIGKFDVFVELLRGFISLTGLIVHV